MITILDDDGKPRALEVNGHTFGVAYNITVVQCGEQRPSWPTYVTCFVRIDFGLEIPLCSLTHRQRHFVHDTVANATHSPCIAKLSIDVTASMKEMRFPTVYDEKNALVPALQRRVDHPAHNAPRLYLDCYIAATSLHQGGDLQQSTSYGGVFSLRYFSHAVMANLDFKVPPSLRLSPTRCALYSLQLPSPGQLQFSDVKRFGINVAAWTTNERSQSTLNFTLRTQKSDNNAIVEAKSDGFHSFPRLADGNTRATFITTTRWVASNLDSHTASSGIHAVIDPLSRHPCDLRLDILANSEGLTLKATATAWFTWGSNSRLILFCYGLAVWLVFVLTGRLLSHLFFGG